MPRGPRLDAPDALHHVMVWGIGGRGLFRDDQDRADLVARLATIVGTTGLRILAWALLPIHFHVLARTGTWPLVTAMRCLLTGYVGAFTRRHRRRGHRVQNRYKSILVEEEPYLRELVRYIHLNPLRAGVVPNLPSLDCYQWTGHSALLERFPRPWQATGEVLELFGRHASARGRYRAFVAGRIARGRGPALHGRGLRRNAGGWEAVRVLPRGREAWVCDERILGSSQFVAQVLRDPSARKGRERWILSR